jgi:hypothetical protein
MFTCVGTETLLINFLGKEVKHLISVVRRQFLSVCAYVDYELQIRPLVESFGFC